MVELLYGLVMIENSLQENQTATQVCIGMSYLHHTIYLQYLQVEIKFYDEVTMVYDYVLIIHEQ